MASERAVTSTAPPGANGLMSRSGLTGHPGEPWAWTGDAADRASAPAKRALFSADLRSAMRMIVLPLRWMLARRATQGRCETGQRPGVHAGRTVPRVARVSATGAGAERW